MTAGESDEATESRTESALIAANHTLELIASGASLTDILEQLCRAIDAQNPELMSTVLLAEPDGRQLRPVVGPRVPSAWPGATAPVTIGPEVGSCGAAAFRKELVVVPDIASDPRWSGEPPRPSGVLAVEHGLRASWSQPLLSKDNQVLGTFCIYYRRPGSPTMSELQLMADAGRLAVIAIEGERSHAALGKALADARDSEARLRAIIDAIPSQAYRLNADATVDYFNRRWHEYTGISPQTARVISRPGAPSGVATAIDLIHAVVHPDDAPAVVAQWTHDVFAAGKAGEFELRLRRHDGEYRRFIARVEPMRDDRGNLVGWCGMNTDIEDLKQAEDKVRQDEQELRRMTDAIAQTVAVLDAEGMPIFVNKALLDYTGLTLVDVKASDMHARISHPEDIVRYAELRREAVARGVPFETEERALRKDGEYRWFLVHYNPLRDEQGRVLRWYATGTEIHDRKLAEERVRNENVALREDIDHSSMFEEIVGSSLRPVLAQVAKVAESDSTVLILGETGTGKELIARAIHKRSRRSSRAFIRVNCAAIPPSLVASELFGHEKGAFTGALQQRLGRFEAADGGTIFLDEIGELPAETQIALLRVLQEREFERVGSSHPIAVDVRVLAATNRDLEAAVEDGGLREDLYYRLNVFPIRIPPLRERVDDIPVLVEYLVERYAKRAGKRIRGISKQTLEQIKRYDWPGNVRELQNVVERAVVLCEGETLAIDGTWLKGRGASKRTAPLTTTIIQREKALIEAALVESHGRVSGAAGAAAKLGIPRQTLESKIKALRINKHSFREP